MFRTSVNAFLFLTFHAFITWFELSRVKLYRIDLKGKKLLRVNWRFELSRVRVTEGKITANVIRKSRRNRLWFELARVKLYRHDLKGLKITSS